MTRCLIPSDFPVLMSDAPELYNTMQAGIKTNIPFDDGIQTGRPDERDPD